MLLTINNNVCCYCIKWGKKQEIFKTFTNTGDDYKTAIEKLDQYFMPKKNIDYEIFQFRQATQKPEETVDQLVTRLPRLAIHCDSTKNSDQLLFSIAN